MKKCNDCKLASRRVSDGCEKVSHLFDIFFKIFMCLYLKKNPVLAEGFVTDITEGFILMIIPKFNIETVIDFRLYKIEKNAIGLQKYY